MRQVRRTGGYVEISLQHAVDHPTETPYVSNDAMAELLANRVDKKLNGIALNLFVPAINVMLKLVAR